MCHAIRNMSMEHGDFTMVCHRLHILVFIWPYFQWVFDIKSQTGPTCSKITMSLVNDSLKFTSSDTQIC